MRPSSEPAIPPDRHPSRVLLFVGFTIRHRRRSGIHRVIVETARALADLVELDLVRWDEAAGALRYLDVAEIDALFGPGDWPAGVSVRPTARRVGGSFWREVGDLDEAWLLAPEVAWHQADGNRILAEVLRQCRQQGLRTVALCYDLIPIRNAAYRDGAALHEAYLRELAGCDLVLPISRDCGAQLGEWWREQGVATPPATVPLLLPDGGFTHDPSRRLADPRASDTPWIVLLGTVEPRKRQLFFLEAMRRARAESPELARYEAVVVGSLQPLVADAFKAFLAANPWVRFLDYASDAEVARLLRGARFTVFASDDEGYGLPIAESLAAGTPCLCADFGAMGEIAVGGGCLAVDVLSEAALRQALVDLCEQPAELARLRADIAVRPFRTWRDYAQAMLAQMAAHGRQTASPLVAGVVAEPPDAHIAADPRHRVLRLVAAPWRLVAAVRREGFGPVLRFLARTLRRRGALGALRLAFAGRQRRATLADARAAHEADPVLPPLGPPDLDERYAMSPQAWAVRFGETGPEAAPETKAGSSAEATFIVGGAADEAGQGPSDRWVVFLKPGDRPTPQFARELAQVTQGGVAEVVSFDMVRRTDSGDLQPLFAPGANPTLYRSVDPFFGRIALRADLLPDQRGLGGTDLRAVVLGWLDRTPPAQARGRWRHVASPVVEAMVTDGEIAAARACVRREPRGEPPPPAVTAVIAMPVRAAAPDRLVRDLLRRPAGAVAKVVVVADGSVDAGALEVLEALSGEPRVELLTCEAQRDLPYLYTFGAAAAPGDSPLLFLDADVAPASADWLERLAASLHIRPEVGAVGPLLRDPDGGVSSAGLYLRPGAAPGHVLRGTPAGEEGYLFLLAAPRETSGLSGAALMTRRAVFETLGGFDADLGSGLFDIDYGRRLVASGWTNVFDPAAVLVAPRRAGPGADSAIRRPALDRYEARWGDTDGADPLRPAGFDVRDGTMRRLAVSKPIGEPADRRARRPAR